MKKRILSIILSIVMLVGLLPTTALAAESYTVYVAGKAMPASADGSAVSYYVNGVEGAAGTVADTEPQSGWNAKLSYDTAEQTLVLEADGLVAPSTTVDGWTDGYGNCYGAIYSPDAPLKIVLKNTPSTIGSSGSNSGSGHGIYSAMALTIDIEVSGNNVTAPGKSTRNSGSWGIRGGGNIVINSSDPSYTLEASASGGSCGYTYGIFSNGSITFNGGTVRATGGSGSSGNDVGISAKGITVNSGATVYGTGGSNGLRSYGFELGGSKTMEVNDGAAVYATGGTGGSSSAGIDLSGNLVINGGIFEAKGQSSTGGSYGVTRTSMASFTINGGQVTLSASGGATNNRACDSVTPTLPTAAYGWKTSAGDDLTLSTTTGYTYDAAHTYLYVETLHAHPVCGDDECADHGDAVTYEVWDGTSEPTGNVYLTNDVNNAITISSGEVNLCLNGHSITKESGTAIKVESGATLNICDCKGNGSISATSNNADITGIDNSGNVNIYGGTVKATRSGYSGSGTGIKNTNGSVTVSGGVIDSSTTGITNACGTLAVSGGTVHGDNTGIGTNSNITISGSPNITGGCDINLYNGSIIIGGALTYAEERAISVQMSTPGTFTSGWTTNMGENADDYDSYFTAWSSSYTVQPDGNELKLAEPPTYTVTYDASGATSGTVPTDGTSYASGSTVTVLGNTGGLAKTGYAFVGWSKYSDASSAGYKQGDTFEITDNMTLYAVWDEHEITTHPTDNSPTVEMKYPTGANYQWYKVTLDTVTNSDATPYDNSVTYDSAAEEWSATTTKNYYDHYHYFKELALSAGDVLIVTTNEYQVFLKDNADTQAAYQYNPTGRALLNVLNAGSYTLAICNTETNPTIDGAKAQTLIFGDAVSGQTDKTLNTSGLESGMYACKITYADGTVLCSGPVEYEAPVHNHSWTYAAEDKDNDGKPETIVATCNGGGTCEATNKELTIVAPPHEQVNDGKAPEATFANNATSVGGVDPLPAIMYQQTATSYPYDPIGAPTATPPTGAGRFEASITVGGQKASVVYLIEKLDREDIKQFTVSDITNNSFVITLHEDDRGKTDFVCQVGGDYIDFTPDTSGKATITVPEAYAGSGNLWVYVYQKETDTHKKSNTKDATVSLLPATPTPAETPVIGTDLSTAEVTYDKDAPATALSITASVTDGGTLSYQWYKNDAASTDGAQAIDGETGASYTPATSAAGTTYYYCVITNTKDGQTATAISAIAKITVNDPAPTTYTVTYDANGGNGTMNAATGISGDYTLPTCTFTAPAGKQFKAWSVGSEEKAAGAVIDVSADITVTALWEDISYSITGSVTDTSAGTATVKLMQGNTEVKTATVMLTGSDTNYTGMYSFTGVAPGVYNIVVTKGDVTMTVLVPVESADVTVGIISMPDGKKNSVLDNTDAGSYAATVGGLDAIANSVTLDSGDSVEIKLTVKAEAVDNADPEHSAIKTVAPGKTLEFIDLSLTKRINSGEETDYGSENTQLLTIVIPFVQGNKQNVTVYRYHGTQATAMTKDPTVGSEGFKLGNGFITIYAKNFSTYAIGYTVPAVNPPSSGGGDYTPTYAITVEKAENGEVKANRSYASSGSTVTITVDPETGYVLNKLTVTDERGNNIEVTDKGDGTFTFKMPGRKVTVEASFAAVGSYSTCPGDHTCPIWPYTDAETTAWYHDGVHYCIDNGLMTGYGNGIFKPNTDTSRAMIAVMLWRLEGSPVVNYLLDFEDVKADAWYTEAIRWAKSEGIIGGYGNGCWGPDDAVTREQMVTILWRYAQYKGYDVSVGENTNILSYDDAFDVAEYAIPAMQWACGSGMVQGMNDPDGEGMVLAPESKGTRAQIATMMMRFCENIMK